MVFLVNGSVKITQNKSRRIQTKLCVFSTVGQLSKSNFNFSFVFFFFLFIDLFEYFYSLCFYNSFPLGSPHFPFRWFRRCFIYGDTSDVCEPQKRVHFPFHFLLGLALEWFLLSFASPCEWNANEKIRWIRKNFNFLMRENSMSWLNDYERV